MNPTKLRARCNKKESNLWENDPEISILIRMYLLDRESNFYLKLFRAILYVFFTSSCFFQ